ncbi:MAG: metallophosphoesterase family protein [Candidatus Methylomirabilales bacterium]
MGSKRQEADHLVGVISDTHGLLRPEAVTELEGSELIIHAGDIGDPEILKELKRIAPVIAVRGNSDKGGWANELPETEVVSIGEVHVYVLHDMYALDLDPVAAGFAAVITGHSHRPKVEEKEGVVFLNPGSAGPRRFNLPVSLARLHIGDGRLDTEIVELDV